MLRSYNLQFEGSYSISYQYPSSKKAENWYHTNAEWNTLLSTRISKFRSGY